MSMHTESAEAQILRLANFIMDEVPGEPSRSEGAIDTAIRLIRDRVPSRYSPGQMQAIIDEQAAELENLRDALAAGDGAVAQLTTFEDTNSFSARMHDVVHDLPPGTYGLEKRLAEAEEMLAWFANNPYAYRIMADKCSEAAAFLAARG